VCSASLPFSRQTGFGGVCIERSQKSRRSLSAPATRFAVEVLWFAGAGINNRRAFADDG